MNLVLIVIAGDVVDLLELIQEMEREERQQERELERQLQKLMQKELERRLDQQEHRRELQRQLQKQKQKQELERQREYMQNAFLRQFRLNTERLLLPPLGGFVFLGESPDDNVCDTCSEREGCPDRD